MSGTSLRPPEALAPFAEAGVLAAADVHVAATAARLAGGVGEDALLGCAFAVRAVRLGHTCVDLGTVAARAAADEEAEVDVAALPWPGPGWADVVGRSALAEDGGPLVLEDGRLYLRRYWQEERQVAADLRALLAAAPPAVDGAVLGHGLEALFEPGRQRDAAEVALRSRVAVVAGGPGTGKTTTVARVVALHVAHALATGGPVPQVALAAPTGKAAARLTEAIREELERLGDAVEPRVRAIVGDLQGSTLHRLLGWRPESHSRFRHDRANRLPHDVVVVDETSMVSLTLMARLLEALRPDARLLLVGDPGQLASVDAGTVLGDLVAAAASPASPLHPVLVSLTEPQRYRDGIDAVAKAIARGDADGVVAALRAGRDDVAWVEGDPAAPGTDLAEARGHAAGTAARVREAAAAGDAEAALRALAGFRLLVAHRRGPHGVSAWNRQAERWTTPLRDREDEWYVGRPVLVGANDASLGVFNGDLGVVVRHGEGRRVAFDRRGGSLQLAPGRLGDVATVHAMTIHKSQGSQFTAVAVLLPDARSRLLTRELLYTGVTRARERLVVVGDEATVRAAVGRPLDRASGLAARLG